MQTGVHVGTGIYGISNRTTLTFDFEPQLILIKHPTESDTALLVRGSTRAQFIGDYSQTEGLYLTWDGASVSFYNTFSARLQFNVQNFRYILLAFG